MDATTSTLVVIEVYDNLMRAEIAKSILDSAGIFCVLNDEYISAIYSVVAFPIRLMVRSEDVEDAQQLLKNENY
ncbi:MAG: DUF2007 domain-containing protein [Alistipes sp.]|jgi:hypothetical protein|nr:DUF2007 domain-containing protein [Alistipes sp.]MBO5971654.1 DUF2007 domain-containing protein [Alistipes sp.]MBO7242383.1 DUF2007 domain-containing protein [Alistipes sp.]